MRAGFARMLYAGLIVSIGFISEACAGIDGFREISPEEDARLPKYCEHSADRGATRVPPTPEAQAWFDIMGPGYKAVHHYCWAMVEIWRADSFKTPPAQKTHWLTSAISNINFVIEHSPPDFILHPEIFTKRAAILVRLGKVAAASADYEKAISLKPNYWPAYVGLAQLMQKSGQVAAARSWVEKGLANAPDSQALLRLRNELNPSAAAPR